MAIIPQGKRRDQVNQGLYKNDSVLSDDFFAKLAITGIGDTVLEEPNSVTDRGQEIVDMVQKVLGLDPNQGWIGKTTFQDGADQQLASVTIQLNRNRQTGPTVQKGRPI